MATWLTSDNEMLDDICRRHYGAVPGSVEAALDANPGLAELGPLLPAGLLVELPELSAEERRGETVRLWD